MCHGELVSTKNVHDSSRSAISEPECLTDNLTAEVFPFSLHRSKNLHLRLEQRRLRFQTLNERHQPLTVRLYGEPESEYKQESTSLASGYARDWFVSGRVNAFADAMRLNAYVQRLLLFFVQSFCLSCIAST